MNTEKLFIFDQENSYHQNLLNRFEKENGLFEIIHKPKELSDNNISEILFLEDNNIIKDICYIEGEKDIKICKIFLYPKKEEYNNRQLISLATNYALNIFNMHNVIIKIDESDKSLLNILEKNNFECLGKENNSILFLKEKEEKEIIQRKVS